MTNVELPGFWLPNDEGYPNLPGGGRYIAIPQGSEPVLKIVYQRTETYRDIEIAPAPRIPLETETGPLEYPTRTDVYSKNAFYPESPVKLSDPSRFRGVDVVMVGITPFQYNPVTKELVVYRDIEIEIEFRGGNGQFGEERFRSRFWDPILADAILNFETLPAVDYSQRTIAQRSSEGCEYLIIIPDGPDYITWANQLRTFRIKQGISTEIVTLSEIGGNNTTMIKSYITNAYNNWDPVPAAILFMGDYGTNQNNNILSPIYNNYCVSDNMFVDINNDHMPDFAHARMTANDNAQLETFVTKIINYETNPPINPGFYDNPITALGWQTVRWFQICSESVGGYFKHVHGKNPVRINEIYAGNPNVDPWSTAQNTSTVLGVFGPSGLGYIPESPQTLGGWSGGNATMINNAINSGAFILQHRDHGSTTGWGEPAYSSNNINGLTNTDLTFVFSINCLTGKYNLTSECFTEKFHRHRHNNINSGALGVNAASETSYSFVNDTYVWGMFDNMWPDFMPQYGSNPPERGLLPAFGMVAGKYFLQQSSWPYNTNNKEVTYHLFHHHGGAFQTLYSEVPQDLAIFHDGVILAGLNEFTITADAGSTICLTVGNNIIGLAEGTGNPVVMTITPQPVGTTVSLTVTKTNYYRYEEPIEVIPATGAYCIYGAHALNDSTGNNNGLPDYNETINLSLTIRNVGLANGEEVTVYLTTTDPYITIIDGEEFYGAIPSQQSVTIADGFEFHIAENTPDQHQVIFNIQSTDGASTWNSLFTIRVNSPVLNINSLTINDQINGNGNGKLDPGEQVKMTINYNNTGHAVAYGIDVYLEGQSGFVEILNPNQHFNSIGFFGMFNKVFDVEIDEDAPEGILVNFLNELSMGIFQEDRIFYEKISAKMENFETGNFTKFPWQHAGDQPWQVTNQYPYQGFFSARSGAIGDNQSSELKLTYNVMTADSISFIRKVSSEPNDKLQFFIGNEMMGEWSGTGTGWVREAYPVSAGNKTFRWVYTKNSSASGGVDMAWLDNIVFPPPVCLTLWAGPDSEVCSGDTFKPEKAYGTAYTTCEWTTSGTGTFNNNTIIQPVYTPSDDDIAAGSVELTLDLWNAGGDNVTDEMLLTFKFAPEAPPVPDGPDYIDLYLTTTSEYTTAGIPGSTDYTWYLEPEEAGAIEGNGMTSLVTWDPDYLGMAYVSVTASNECGEGEVSEAFEVTVDNTVGIPQTIDESFGVSVFPNPGDGKYQVTVTSADRADLSLKVFNVLGSLIYESLQTSDGIIHETLNLENLPNGIYFLEIRHHDQVITRKLIKR
ncbi:MAG: C25 family cysteine peptidase, partial [Bacteroidales bacterium]